jgi:hypothetical protein
LSDEEKTRRDQLTYSEAYFTELSERIHKEANRKLGLSELPIGEVWNCPATPCFFRHESMSKSYLMVHLQEYHNEDVGCTSEEELAGRALSPPTWRCRYCFGVNGVSPNNACCYCKAPCEEIRIKARAELSFRENGMGTIQQDSPPVHASTIASSQSIEQGETSHLDTSMEHRSETLQPHVSLPEPVTIPRYASNAALELPASTTAIRPTISEKRHQDGNVGVNQSSGSYNPQHPLFCVGDNCHFGFSTFAGFRRHLVEYHNASVIASCGKLIYEVREIVLRNVKSTGLIVFHH